METLKDGEHQCLAFETNVGDTVVVDREHPLWVEEGENGPIPLVRVRDGLNALLSRSVFYELGEAAITRNREGNEVFSVTNRGEFFGPWRRGWTLNPGNPG